MRLLRTYAITIYGLVMLGLATVGIVANIQYDAGILGGLLYIFFAYIFPVFGFMFYWPEVLLDNLILSMIVGLSFCGGIDYFRHRLQKQRKRDEKVFTA